MAKKVCNNCGETKTPSTVPYSVFCELKDLSNRTIKRLWILLIIAWAAVLLAVGAFTYERLKYDYVGETQEEVIVDGKEGGTANYIGNNRDIINGEGNSKEVHDGQAQN